MKLASSAINTAPLCLHALEAYSSFLKEGEHNNFDGRLKKARSFIRTYPDLAQWQKLKLLDRIGSNKPRRGISFITFNARPYL